MKRRLLTTAWLMLLTSVFAISTMAQTVTVQVNSAGGLWDALEAQGVTDFTTVKNLTVTGVMGESDFLLIKNQMSSLESIDISGTNVTVIPSKAFSNKEKLKSARLPEKITNIRNEAFSHCQLLESVTFGSQTSETGKIVFPASLTYVDYNAFYYCISLTHLDFSACTRLEGISSNAFTNLFNLTEVLLPSEGNFYLEWSCFNVDQMWDESSQSYVYKGLTQITLTKAVGRISGGCFPPTLRTLYIESSTPAECDEGAFNRLFDTDASTLKVYVPKGSKRNYAIANGFSVLYPYMQEFGIQLNISGYGSLLQDNRTYRGGDVFFYTQGGAATLKAVPEVGCELISVKLDGNALSVAADGTFTIPAGTTIGTLDVVFSANPLTIANPNGSELKDLIAATGSNPNTLRTLKVTGKMTTKDWNYVMSSMPQLEMFDISETTATTVPEQALRDKDYLTTVHLPSTVITIGSQAFYNCDQLASIDGCENVQEIGSAAFCECYKLTNFPFDNKIQRIESEAFKECKSLPETLVMPASLNFLGWSYVFDNSSVLKFDLSQCTLSCGLGYNTFGKCTSLLLPEKGEYHLGCQALRDAQLTELRLPAAVSYIDCDNVLPTMLERLYVSRSTPFEINGSDVFRNLDLNMCKLYVPVGSADAYAGARGWASFTNIHEYGFIVKTGGLGEVKYNGKSYKDGEAFSSPEGTALTMQIIPAYGYEIATLKVGGMALDYANDGTFTVPATITGGTIDVTFTKAQLQLAVTMEGNGSFTIEGQTYTASTTLPINGGEVMKVQLQPATGSFVKQVTINGEDVVLKNGGLEFTTDVLGANTNITIAFSNDVTSVATVTFEQEGLGTVTYGGVTFEDGNTLTLVKGKSITLTFEPNGDSNFQSLFANGTDVTSDVVNGQWSLANVQTSTTVKTVFFSPNVITVENPNGGELKDMITAMGSSARSIRSLKVIGKMNNKDWNFVMSMSAIEEFDISKTDVKVIPEQAFQDKDNLTTVHLPSTVITIGNQAFYSCDQLTTVDGCEKVKEIGSSAFGYCYKLSSFPFGNEIRSIESDAFTYCTSLPETLVMPASLTTLGWGNVFNYSSILNFDLSQCTLNGQFAYNTFGQCTSLLLPEKGDYQMAYSALKEAQVTELRLPAAVTGIYGENVLPTLLERLYVSRSIPFEVGDNNSFRNIDFDNCVLYVPVGSADAYAEAPQWASFSIIKEYGMSVVVGEQGKVRADTQTLMGTTTFFPKGTTATFEIIPNEGWHTDAVKLDGVDIPFANNKFTLSGEHLNGKLVITFAVNQYDLQIQITGNGKVKFGSLEYTTNQTLPVDHLSTLTFTLEPADGLVVSNITFNNQESVVQNGGTTYVTPAITANSTLAITFGTAGSDGDAVTYTVTTDGEGSVEYKNTTLMPQATILVKKGENAVFAMKPEPYNIIDVVKLNGQDVTNQLDAAGQLTIENVTADATLEVTFRVNAEISVIMENGGTLKNLISEKGKQNVTKLIVKGPIWDEDFYTMRDEMPKLSVIDLWEAQVESIPGQAFCTVQSWDGNSVGKKTLTSIRLPETTRNIYGFAFAGCSNLKEVNFTALKNLEYMDSYTFESTALQVIDLSNTKLTEVNNSFRNVRNLENIKFPQAVTRLGEVFFRSNMTEIDLSEYTNLKKLEGTFNECKNLVKVNLPEGLTSITNSAFSNCTSLTTVNFPKSLQTIGGWSFFNSKLQKADLSALTNLRSIGEYAFHNCQQLTEVLFPTSLEQIGNYAFNSCQQLTSVDLSKTQLQSIPEYAFSSCSALESVKLPKMLETIGGYAFADNYKLGGVLELGAGFTSIGEYAFGNTQISLIKSEATIPPVLNNNTLPDTWAATFVPEGCAEAYRSAAVWGDKPILDKEVHAEVTVTKVGNLAIDINNQAHVMPATITHLKVHGPLGKEDFDIMRENMTLLYDLDMSDADASIIHENAFNSVKKKVLMHVKLPNNLLRIEPYAFRGCSSLKGSLTLPSGLKFIGYGAFEGCTSLEEVVLNESLQVIQGNAFNGCTSLEQELTLPASMQSLGEYAFANCTSLYGTVKFNRKFYQFMGTEGYGSSAGSCFENCSKIETVDLSDATTLTEIPFRTFAGCTSLTTVLFPSRLKRIDNEVFDGCSTLDGIKFPNTLQVINYSAFRYCTSLRSIDLSDCKKLGTIEGYAFFGCSGLETAYLPKSLNWIREYAFADCRKLANLTVEAVKPADLGEYVFHHVHTDRCVLSIPTGTFEKYLSAAQWGEFVSMRKEIDVKVGEGANLYFLNKESSAAAAPAFRRAPAVEQQGAMIKDGSSLYVQENEEAVFMVKPEENVQIEKVLFNGQDVTSQMVNGTYRTPGVTDASSFEVQVKVVGDIHVKELRMLDEDVAVMMGEECQLRFAVYPTNATNKAIQWTSSDETKATVNSDGIVTGVAPGNVEITAKTADGGYEETCQIIVVSNNYWLVMDNKVDDFVENTVRMSLALHNEGEARDIQFDVYMPEGVDMDDSYENFGIELSGRANAHILAAARMQSDRAVRVIVYSRDGNQFQGIDGELLTLPFVTGAESGDFEVTIKNIHISGTNNFDFAAPNHTVTFNLKDYPLGDSNGNGEVTTFDAVITVDEILQQNGSRFIRKAADVNQDDQITVSDVTGIIDIVLGRTPNRAAANRASDATGRLYMNNLLMSDGVQQKTLSLQLEHAANFIGFQCDIYLPAGMTLVRDENDLPMVALNGVSSHSLSSRLLDNGALRVVVYSPLNDDLSVLESNIVNLTVMTDGTMVDGSTIDIRDIRLVRKGNSEYMPSDASASIHFNVPTAIDSILLAKGMKVRAAGHYLVIESSVDTILPVVSTDGITRNLQIHEGENRIMMENAGVYIIGGKKFVIK